MTRPKDIEVHPRFRVNMQAVMHVYRELVFGHLHDNTDYDTLGVDDDLALTVVGAFMLVFHGMGEAEVLAGAVMYPDTRLVMLVGAAEGVLGNPEYQRNALQLTKDEARRVGWSQSDARELGRTIRKLHEAVNDAAPILRALQRAVEDQEEDAEDEGGGGIEA